MAILDYPLKKNLYTKENFNELLKIFFLQIVHYTGKKVKSPFLSTQQQPSLPTHFNSGEKKLTKISQETGEEISVFPFKVHSLQSADSTQFLSSVALLALAVSTCRRAASCQNNDYNDQSLADVCCDDTGWNSVQNTHIWLELSLTQLNMNKPTV